MEELKETPQLHEAYRQLWAVVRLPAMQRFTVVLLLFRLAMLPAEQAAPLKLLEKGVSKEALAGLVLLEFPCELVSALVAGKWATGAAPLRPWLLGYRLRLFMAAVVTALVCVFSVVLFGGFLVKLVSAPPGGGFPPGHGALERLPLGLCCTGCQRTCHLLHVHLHVHCAWLLLQSHQRPRHGRRLPDPAQHNCQYGLAHLSMSSTTRRMQIF